MKLFDTKEAGLTLADVIDGDDPPGV